MNRSALQHARALDMPLRDDTLRRARSVHDFWAQNRTLLQHAWQEWETREGAALPVLGAALLHPALRDALAQAWDSPEADHAVQALWQPVAPGVYQCPFFDPAKLSDLRAYLDAAAGAGIPARPPYGIVLNRDGVMLDPRSTGHLAAPSFQAFYRLIMDRIMRPVSRLLFPEVAGFDTQSFGFSIRYQPGMDTAIRPHTDASATTLNINMNLPEEDFGGSEVDFFGPGGQRATFTFAPGVAVIHRGGVAHQARPITSGARSNLVLWLYGEQGRMPMGRATGVLTPAERWTVPSVVQDGFAPF